MQFTKCSESINLILWCVHSHFNGPSLCTPATHVTSHLATCFVFERNLSVDYSLPNFICERIVLFLFWYACPLQLLIKVLWNIDVRPSHVAVTSCPAFQTGEVVRKYASLITIIFAWFTRGLCHKEVTFRTNGRVTSWFMLIGRHSRF